MNLVDSITRIYHDARSRESQKKGGTVSLLQIIIPTLFQNEYKA